MNASNHLHVIKNSRECQEFLMDLNGTARFYKFLVVAILLIVFNTQPLRKQETRNKVDKSLLWISVFDLFVGLISSPLRLSKYPPFFVNFSQLYRYIVLPFFPSSFDGNMYSTFFELSMTFCDIIHVTFLPSMSIKYV